MDKISDKLIFRGYSKKETDHWVAICIDLNIAAQGTTADEAIQTCSELVEEYIDYVCSEYPREIDKYIYRPAPEEFIVEYNWIFSNIITHREKKKTKEDNSILNFNFEPSKFSPCIA